MRLPLALLTSLLAIGVASAQQPHTFAVSGDRFTLDGQPLQIISGAIPYERVRCAYWRDHLRRGLT